MPEQDPYVIVGAGLAGAKAAEGLRNEGFAGRILVLGTEPEPPYERPPLSKDYLRGESARNQIRVHPEGFYAEQSIELRLGVTASAVEPRSKAVVTADGESIGYEKLLLATGAEPRRLAVPGAELDGIHYLRDLADADRLAPELAGAERVVVIGAGWIGAEVAASARQKEAKVTVIERAQLPLERVLGAELGSIYAGIHRAHGVDLRLGAGLEAFEGDGSVKRVRLNGGEIIECDLVVAGVGVIPRTELAQSAGLEVDNGIAATAGLETSEAGIFVAGDVANAFHPFYGRRIRVEHWANAIRQGELAAKAMLGKPVPGPRLPYFFSDQYDVGMEYTGLATEWDEVVFRGDPAGAEFIAFWISDGCVVAGMNVNVWDVADSIEVLIRSRRQIDLDRLRDPEVALDRVAHDVGGREHAQASESQ